jgi:hypothetical protein
MWVLCFCLPARQHQPFGWLLLELFERSLHAQVEIENGVFELTLSNPDGIVTGVRYNGVDNLMEILNNEDNRGYVLYFFNYYFISILSSLFPLCHLYQE